MGAYAIYSDKPFKVPDDKLHCIRKPNARLERAMALIDNADEIKFDIENERMLFSSALSIFEEWKNFK